MTFVCRVEKHELQKVGWPSKLMFLTFPYPNPTRTPCTRGFHRVFNNPASGIVPSLVANVPLILQTGLLLDLSQSLLSSSKTHLHIAVVHDTAYNIFIISFRVMKIIQIRGLGFKTSTMILFILPYPVFIFCFCFSSMFYVKGIIHRCFYTIWSLRHMFCQLY